MNMIKRFIHKCLEGNMMTPTGVIPIKTNLF